MPTAIVQQVAQVLVIDQNDVLSIAADMAVAAAMAAAAEDKSIHPSDMILETLSSTTTDIAAYKDVADGIGADEIIGEILIEEISSTDKNMSENLNDMLLRQANASSTYTTMTESVMTVGSEFTFSPITLAPESSRPIKVTVSKTLAHTSPVVMEKIKSSASVLSFSFNLYFMFLYPFIFYNMI